ncbi:lipase/esterase family protein [Aspergillus lucknowensis]|uniref:Alpha/beta hydrolase fold-3 domain-containing protein n=1 Tax=Aspergillus lucknowensis TaxID=176173 RepID=A0ABR4LPI2_9EURO
MMALSSFSAGMALTPTVVSTLFSHYLNRKALHNKPNVHLSYDEGISVIREFINFSSKRPIEFIQEFTGQRVPAPHWIKVTRLSIPEEYLSSAADALVKQLGPEGIARVGGEQWWKWRGPAGDTELRGEWIEMKSDYNERKRIGRNHPSQKRIMLYIHGGAYYFGSVETHRYQLQRHARKLKGRVFAPEYRLSPQFPFPCGLQDSLAAYIYLLKDHSPNEIIFAGDSAGGGMILSMLVICRDQGLPLPAGAILISPWVDLTHSLPSIAKDNPGDYIPSHGFLHKPSVAWPPPNEDEIKEIKRSLTKNFTTTGPNKDKTEGKSKNTLDVDSTDPALGSRRPPPSFIVDGKTIQVKDQIHMYTTNDLLFHPLVSPIFQPSLGGLPPLQIISGGGEMLRDEQFYVAHKAANPGAYPPSDTFLEEFDPERKTLDKYPGTYVQLQVWDDLCHVAPILSFTRPAKYIFRSIAQFGAWALARAQDSNIDILNDDEVSPISSSDSDDPQEPVNDDNGKEAQDHPAPTVGRAGDPLPAFKDRMIRQGVNKRGHIYPLDPPHSCPVLQIPPSSVGAINPAVLMNWMLAKEAWDHKFAKEKAHVHQQRVQGLAFGFQSFDGDIPPPSSLAARRFAPGALPPKGIRTSHLMSMWSKLASKHDRKSLKREHKMESHSQRTSVDAGRAGASIKEGEENQEKKTSLPVEEQSSMTTSTNKLPASEKGLETTAYLPRISHDKTFAPLIVLPNYEGKPNDEYENASTRALFHVPGTIPPVGDSRSTQRPTSRTGSATIRSGFTSEPPDDASTVGDEKSLAVTGTGVDAASTRAVLHAAGVIGVVNDENSIRHSVDSLHTNGLNHDVQQ